MLPSLLPEAGRGGNSIARGRQGQKLNFHEYGRANVTTCPVMTLRVSIVGRENVPR
jgi:hypothetical protein